MVVPMLFTVYSTAVTERVGGHHHPPRLRRCDARVGLANMTSIPLYLTTIITGGDLDLGQQYISWTLIFTAVIL